MNNPDIRAPRSGASLGEWNDFYARENEQLRAQLSTLQSKLTAAREALEKVANVHMGDPPTPETQVNALVRCRHIARLAIANLD